MRIRHHSSFLGDILQDVIKGGLVPAAFQRPYVWGKADVLSLCKSILLGYPFGSFLIWAPNDKADLSAYGQTRLGPIQRTTSARPAALLLDGQNRLASFAWMTQQLHEKPTQLSEQERATWDCGETLVVDLGRREMRFVPESEAVEGFTLPAYALLDCRVGMRLIRERLKTPGWNDLSEADRDAGWKWWDDVASSRFREARATVTLLEDATLEEARDAFLHICKVGVPMSEADFDAALRWSFPSKR